MAPLLTTSYLPPVEYFAFLTQEEAWLEYCEHYRKQTFRNRCVILTSNGPEALTVPIVHSRNHEPIAETRIDYAMPWQRTHWRAIVSAYGCSPYFLYYQDALLPFYEQRHERLFDFNLQLTRTLLRMLQLPAKLHLTEKFTPPAAGDLRTLIQPHGQAAPDYVFRLTKPYYQVFEHKFGFVPNLSIIDLIFNTGPAAVTYLRNLRQHFTTLNIS